MAIFCITTSNPEFQKLLAESGEKQGVFAMMVSKWMTENEVYDRYPTLQELGITAMDSIKPGVQELFETNPELANAVYEALGLINTSEIQLDGPKCNPDNYEAISYSIGMAGVELEKEFQGKGYGTKVYIALAEQLAKEGKTLKSEAFGKEDINKSANRVWKSLLNKGYAVDKGSYFEIQLKNKQQAQQLYSQYLDTIFPDSKVKDIVYHGANEPIEGGKFAKRDGATGKGIWFSGSKKYAQIQMDRAQPSESLIGRKLRGAPTMYQVVLNIKNPKNFYNATGALLVQTPSKFEEQYDRKTDDAALFHHPNSKKPATADSADQVVVFEPEQIHILGSKQDIEGFKEFVGNVGDVATDIGLDMSSDEAKAFNSLVNDGTISIKCE
jgi:GNAT superfamily N-acetyltransferase